MNGNQLTPEQLRLLLAGLQVPEEEGNVNPVLSNDLSRIISITFWLLVVRGTIWIFHLLSPSWLTELNEFVSVSAIVIFSCGVHIGRSGHFFVGFCVVTAVVLLNVLFIGGSFWSEFDVIGGVMATTGIACSSGLLVGLMAKRW